ncbi:MAG TPA: hypothetical protein P5239_10380, partial [Victivallales bacterium]|nr:hypothetical protein [Victivallales bacterium]
IIDDGKTGYLVPLMDIESLISKTYGLLFNKILLQEMAKESVRRATNLFNTDEITTQYLKFFTSILQN